MKILEKKIFDQAIFGGDTIFPLSLRLSGIEFSFDILAQDWHLKPSLAPIMDRISEKLVLAHFKGS